ncbi:hypothetical protein F5Y06DRAFT_299452 [Hypoxylon sp. FL0890]|nr:hypothetical protein F5Y06DRAFT_299452 [Hypoxylon sp. FL0890]
MARVGRQASSFKRSLGGILQTLFALTVFAIFVITWLVQGETITLPQWAIAWNGVSPELQKVYTAALVPAVLILAILFFAAGFFMMMRERRENRRASMEGRWSLVGCEGGATKWWFRILAAVAWMDVEIRSDERNPMARVLFGSTIFIALEWSRAIISELVDL